MQDKKISPTTIDEYISDFPENIQRVLQEIRQVIKTSAPEAEEKISYQIPTFYLKGNLVHFAAQKNHIGFYPTSSGVKQFAPELMPYGTSKGAIRFPLDQPVPYDLIQRIVEFRVIENLERVKQKEKMKKEDKIQHEYINFSYP